MFTVNSLLRSSARLALLCTLASTAVSVSSTANAAITRTLTISGTPAATVTTPNLYSFQPVAHDSVPSRLRFDITNKPVWAVFDANTGKLSGRPNPRQVGTYSNIRIRLIDWYGHSDLTFSIKVLPVQQNTAPTISGRPIASVSANAAYTFTPVAADAEKKPLNFSIQNKPAWASFNAASGTLSGTPRAADVGSYANIRISVSDGQMTTALPAFSVTVTQIATANITLDWTPPTENTDGSTLSDLAGYRIHYGTSKDNLSTTAQVANAGLASYVVDQLTPGTWYFTVTAYSASGVESAPSAVISTTIL